MHISLGLLSLNSAEAHTKWDRKVNGRLMESSVRILTPKIIKIWYGNPSSSYNEKNVGDVFWDTVYKQGIIVEILAGANDAK